MICYLRTHVCKQPIIALYFELETVLKFYNLDASPLETFIDFGVYPGDFLFYVTQTTKISFKIKLA